MRFFRFCLSTAFVVGLVAPAAAVSVSNSATATFTSPDRNAVFTQLTNGDSLLNYTEDGLRVSVDDTQYEPGVFFGDGINTNLVHYGQSGNASFVTIARTDTAPITDLEFRKGTGYNSCLFNGGTGCSFVWEALRGGSTIDSGRVANYVVGDYYRFSDAQGFDAFRVASYNDLTSTFGATNAIALGDVRVGSSVAPVPLPATAMLLMGGLAGLGALGRRRS